MSNGMLGLIVSSHDSVTDHWMTDEEFIESITELEIDPDDEELAVGGEDEDFAEVLFV